MRNICIIEDCYEYVKGNGYCKSHYEKDRKYGDPLHQGLIGRPPNPRKTCSVTDCTKVSEALGFCVAHYTKFRRFGDPLGSKPREVKYGRTESGERITSEGYVDAKDDEGKWVREHKLVMESVIGRELYPHEQVHHMNGQRDDNRIDNLELWSISQPPGQRVTDKIEWAISYLEQYGYKVIS